METNTQQICRDSAASLFMDWLSHAPYQMSSLRIEKVGFADIPVCYVMVACKHEDLSSLIPVIRQFVYRELEGAGIENEIVEFTPSVQRGKRQRFVDCNEHSESCGKNKMGNLHRVSFEIKRPFLDYFVWEGFCRKTGRIPERKIA